jgi:hypothetical protein
MNHSRGIPNGAYTQPPMYNGSYGAPNNASAPQSASLPEPVPVFSQEPYLTLIGIDHAMYATHRAAATMQRPVEPHYQVTPELIEYEVSKSITQLNHCLSLLASFHAAQRTSPENRMLSDQLLLAHEIHNARRELVAWTNKFNRGTLALFQCSREPFTHTLLFGAEISGAFHNHQDYHDSVHMQMQRSSGRSQGQPGQSIQPNSSAGMDQGSEKQRQSSSSASSTRSEPAQSPNGSNHQTFHGHQTSRRQSISPATYSSVFGQADQDPIGTSSAPSDDDPDDISLSPRGSSVIASPVRLATPNVQHLKMQGNPSARVTAVAAVAQEVQSATIKTEVVEDRAKRSRKRASPEDAFASSTKRRALPVRIFLIRNTLSRV